MTRRNPKGEIIDGVPTAVCKNHREEYLAHLVCTFAWKYKEFWCAYCGATYDYFGPDAEQDTDELKRRHELYQKASANFLYATAMIEAGAQTEYHGRRCYFHDLPEGKQLRLREDLEAGWTYGRKAEDLKGEVMASERVAKAIDEVRKAKARAIEPLGGEEYNEFLEELLADAEGWEMELKERRGEAESDSDEDSGSDEGEEKDS